MSKNIQVIFLGSLLILAVVFSGYQFVQKQKEGKSDESILKIGVITDAHFYADKPKKKKSSKKDGVDESSKTGEWRLNWRSREALERFVEKMNKEFKPDIVVDIGDFIDGKDRRSYETWKSAEKIFKKIKAPAYHVLGNHETNSFSKETWLELTDYEKTYYYKDVKKGNEVYRMIMLDGNYLPDNSDATPEKHHYPGHIDDVQWQWLEGVLGEAQDKDMSILVFVHQPPVEMDFWQNFGIFPQGEKLQELFDKSNVRAVFAGHIEQMCNTINGKTRYFVLQGMWKKKNHLKEEYRFKDAGNFYYVTVTPDDIIVESEYRVFDDTIKKGNHLDKLKEWRRSVITEEEFNCQDGQQLLESEKDKKVDASKSILPVTFFKNEFKEISGITFFKGATYLVSDDGFVVKLKDNKVSLRKELLGIDAEGVTHDNNYIYILSESDNSIYQLDHNLNVVKKQSFPAIKNEDANLGLEGVAYYKDNLFFVTHQDKDVDKNIFLVDFSDGSIVRSGKLKHGDLSGATYLDDVLYIVSGSSRMLLKVDPLTFEVLIEEELRNKNTEGVDISNGVIYLIKDNEEELREGGKL